MDISTYFHCYPLFLRLTIGFQHIDILNSAFNIIILLEFVQEIVGELLNLRQVISHNPLNHMQKATLHLKTVGVL